MSATRLLLALAPTSYGSTYTLTDPINGVITFRAPRADGQCGPSAANAACDPTNAPCCSAAWGRCKPLSASGGCDSAADIDFTHASETASGSMDAAMGLAMLLDPAPLPSLASLGKHCVPRPATRMCCTGEDPHNHWQLQVELSDVPEYTTRNLNHVHGIDLASGIACADMCRDVHGTWWNGYAWTEPSKDPMKKDTESDCFCTKDSVNSELIRTFVNHAQCFAMDLHAHPTDCKLNLFALNDCPSQTRVEEYAFLRKDEVIRGSFFHSTSDHFTDSKRFDLTKCCDAFDVWIEPINRGPHFAPNANGLPREVSKYGWKGAEFVEQMFDTDLTRAYNLGKSGSPYFATNKETACLKIIQHDGVSDAVDGWKERRVEWFRSVPGWNEGKNWMVSDSNDWGPGEGIRIMSTLTPEDVPGMEIVSPWRTDRALVLKTSMTRGPITCDPMSGLYCHMAHIRHGTQDPTYGYRPFFDVAQPLISNHPPPSHALPAEHTFAMRKDLAFFKGLDRGFSRQALINAHDPSIGFIAVTYVQKGHEGGAKSDKNGMRFDYIKTLLNTKFGLAPPGIGLHSYRLNEVMQWGTVPVVVTPHLNEYVLPFAETLDWTKFSFMWKAVNVPTLPAYLQSIDAAKWTRMQKRSLLVVKHFLREGSATGATWEILRRRIAVAAEQSSTCPNVMQDAGTTWLAEHDAGGPSADPFAQQRMQPRVEKRQVAIEMKEIREYEREFAPTPPPTAPPKCATCASRDHMVGKMWPTGTDMKETYTYLGGALEAAVDQCCDAAAKRGAHLKLTVFWSFNQGHCYMKLNTPGPAFVDMTRPNAISGCANGLITSASLAEPSPKVNPTCGTCEEQKHLIGVMWSGNEGETYKGQTTLSDCCAAAARRAKKHKYTVFWSFGGSSGGHCYMKSRGDTYVVHPAFPDAISGCVSSPEKEGEAYTPYVVDNSFSRQNNDRETNDLIDTELRILTARALARRAAQGV